MIISILILACGILAAKYGIAAILAGAGGILAAIGIKKMGDD